MLHDFPLREPLTDDEYAWVSVRCSPYYANTPLYPIVDHLKRVMRWRAEDTAQERLQKLEAALQSQSTPLPEVVPLIADLMSMTMPNDRYPAVEMTTQQRRDATLDAIVSWMLELCEAKPVLSALDQLVDDEVLYQRGRGHRSRYIFKHALIR